MAKTTINVCVKDANVPDPLKALDSCVLWKPEWNEKRKRWDKLPISPKTFRLSNHEDPKTRMTFSAALALHQNYPQFGIGVSMDRRDGYTAVDIDHCVTSVEGQYVIDDRGRYAIDLFRSYWEVSPSGTGIRIFIKGSLPEGVNGRNNRVKGVEVYSGRHFLTITGDVPDGRPCSIEMRQRELDVFYAEYFPEPAPAAPQESYGADWSDEEVLNAIHRSARHVYLLEDLKDGDFSKYGGDVSSAEAAAMEMLLFYSGGHEGQVERLFRELMPCREKWDTLRGQMTYVQYSIARIKKKMTKFRTRQQPDAEWAAPIKFEQPARPEFPVEVFPPWIRTFVSEVAEALQVPVDLPAMLALVVLAAALSKKAIIRRDNSWVEPLNIYVIVVLPPASRKSAVFKMATGPITVYEKELIEAARISVKRDISDRVVKENRIKNLQAKLAKLDLKPAEAQQCQEQLNMLSDELASVKEAALPRLVADNATPEKLASLLSQNEGKIAVLSAEGDVIDIMAGRYAKGNADIGIFLKGHAGDIHYVDRQGRPSECIQDPAITLGLAVQPDVLSSMMDNPSFRGRGLVGRFLYSVPANEIGRRGLTAEVNVELREAYNQNIRALLEADFLFDDVIDLSEEARAVFDSFSITIEKRLGDHEDLGGIQDWAGKLAGATLRIAGLLHVADYVGKVNADRVGVETMRSAIQLAGYLIEHAKAAFGCVGGKAASDAQILLTWIAKRVKESSAKPVTFTRSEISEGVRRSIPAKALDGPLKDLVERGYLERIFRVKQKGRPAELFAANPHHDWAGELSI